MKTFFYAAAFLALFGSLKLYGADLQPAGSTAVETIVFLRHGEKPDKEIGQLNCQGLNRALALPRILSSKFGKPDYIFAPARSESSQFPHSSDAPPPNALLPREPLSASFFSNLHARSPCGAPELLNS
jgi:hypothetical protein